MGYLTRLGVTLSPELSEADKDVQLAYFYEFLLDPEASDLSAGIGLCCVLGVNHEDSPAVDVAFVPRCDQSEFFRN